jgi:hypothetical protein
VRGHPYQTEGAVVDVLPDKMISDVDVLCALMEFGGCGEGNRSCIVEEDFDGCLEGDQKLGEEGLQPESLLNDMCDGHVLCFGGRQSDRSLLL